MIKYQLIRDQKHEFEGWFQDSAAYDEQAATVGNGMMVALNCHDNDKIDAMHAKALELGATDDGAPGERVPGMFHGAYVRDLDGNKLCFYKMGG